MRRMTIPVGLLLLLGVSTAKGHDSFAAPHWTARNLAGEVALGEVAQYQYKQLRAEALANAEVRVTPKRKNPRIAGGGLDPDVFRILDQQQAYLASRPAHNVANRTSNDFVPQFACNGPAIRSVNGNHDRPVFTPRTPGNVYAIEGCSFGSERGLVQLERRAPSLSQPGWPIVLQLDHSVAAWTDREINVHIDPYLSGIPDSPVTLVVYTPGGLRIELPGCFFVAGRGEPRLLTVIPATWVRLHATTVHSRAIRQLEYISPPILGSETPKDATGTTVLVIRSDSEAFTAGSDAFDFSQLGPGWAVESVQLQTYAVSCPSDLSYTQSFGRWDLAWGPKSFTVSWEGNACSSYALPFITFDLSLSLYAAKVWVIGPVGTEPVPGVFHR